jgi:hypothetical protein
MSKAQVSAAIEHILSSETPAIVQTARVPPYDHTNRYQPPSNKILILVDAAVPFEAFSQLGL